MSVCVCDEEAKMRVRDAIIIDVYEQDRLRQRKQKQSTCKYCTGSLYLKRKVKEMFLH